MFSGGGGAIAPGDNSAATLTLTTGLHMSTGNVFDMDLGTTSDRLRISGGTFTGPSGTGGLSVLVRDGGGLVFNQQYIVIDWTGTTLQNVELSDFVVANGSVPGELSIQGSTLVFTPIPEPGTILAVAAAGVAIGWLRRRTNPAGAGPSTGRL